MTAAITTLRSRIAEPMRRHGVVHAGVFGSVARGDNHAGSDLDILVEFEPGRSLLHLSGLRIELTDLLGRDVDLATRGSLHPRLRDRILVELVPLL
jgi:predicted nucleotidyltransferase